MILHRYITTPCVFTVIFLIPLTSMAINKLAIERSEYTLSAEKLIAKTNPVIKVKKIKPSKGNCTIVRGENWTPTNETISVGLKALTARSRLRLGSSIFSGSGLRYLQTCKFIFNSGKFRSTYALSDNSKLANTTITVYLDGEKNSSITVSRGESDTLDINTSGFKSIAIEIDGYMGNESGIDSSDYIYAIDE
jgi:hypothetical protein